MAKFELPKLEYDYGAFGTYISARIMELHYTKHHERLHIEAELFSLV